MASAGPRGGGPQVMVLSEFFELLRFLDEITLLSAASGASCCLNE